MILLMLVFLQMGQRPDHASDDPARRTYNRALGVECDFCHVDGDWANPARAPLATARQMVRMVEALNSENLAGTRGVSCLTCHRGARTPSRFPPEALPAALEAWPASLGESHPRRVTMGVYAASLGVGCDHCHSTDDWTSTAKKPHQMTARMTAMFDVFPKYMPASARTQCWMCHQGSVRPARAE